MRNLLTNNIVFAAADDTGTGAAETAQAGASTETLLYGTTEEKPVEAGKADGETTADAWKEYETDAAKTDEENAAAKAEHDKSKPTDAEEAPADEADKVPEDGVYKIALADGVQLDQALLDKAAPVMKELGLTNGQATKLAGVIAEQRKAEFDALNESHQKIIAGWQKDIKTDKDFGGEKLDVSLKTANRVIATFGDDGFKSDLVDLGIGNHPGLFRLLARVGNALSDDKPITSETPAAPVPKDTADILYGPSS